MHKAQINFSEVVGACKHFVLTFFSSIILSSSPLRLLNFPLSPLQLSAHHLKVTVSSLMRDILYK